MALTYQIVTGPEMIYTVSGVVQIFNQTPALVPEFTAGTPLLPGRSSRTFFSMNLFGLNATADDGQADFQIYIPMTMDLSDLTVVGSGKWTPFFSIQPLNADASDYSVSLPLLTISGAPNATTRLLPFSLAISAVTDCNFALNIDFKHSIL